MAIMYEYTFDAGLALLALIVGLFLQLYPKVRDFIDTSESEFRAEYVKSLAQSIVDLGKENPSVYDENRRQWISTGPSVEVLERIVKTVVDRADEFWSRVRDARKLRDNSDMVIFSYLIGVFAFFVTPLFPQIFAQLILSVAIGATTIGSLVLFHVVKKLY
jgi:hypothetical protein